MDKDYEDLYLNLDVLLKDICRFLETNSLQLSPSDKKQAQALIERSKKHLQTIEKLNTNENKCCDSSLQQFQDPAEGTNKNETERYVDMNKKPGPALPQRIPIVELPLYESQCPFQDLPAKKASQEIKYGTLTKRRKVLNIIDVSTKIYAAIHDNWLLIYNSSKDLKPECALDLKQYEAKEDETDPNLTQVEVTKDVTLKKNTFNFKMASSFKVFDASSSQKKCYSFVATTHKDMLQWVVNINRRHDKAVLTPKRIQEEQNYEICQDFQEQEEENIYNEIEMPCRSAGSRVIPKYNNPPAVPEKRPIGTKNVPPSSISQSTESMVSYEELQGKGPRDTPDKSSIASFETSSEEEEDQTYYELDMINKHRENGKQGNGVAPPRNTPESDSEDAIYENGITTKTNQLPNQKSDLKNAVTKSKALANTVINTPPPTNGETTRKPDLSEKNITKPLITKPKILTPKPWKPFRKNLTGNNLRSPQIAKNKSIRESLKNSPNMENKLPGKESGCKKVTSPNENCSPVNNDASKPLNNGSSEKSNKESSEMSTNPCSPTSNTDSCDSSIDSRLIKSRSSIVQIVRNRWSTSQSPPCSLETFSRNTKIETFQASPTKETPPADFLRSPATNVNDSIRTIETVILDSTQNGISDDKKPMVLLKTSLEDDESSTNLKKSPVVPSKPKKVAKKLAF